MFIKIFFFPIQQPVNVYRGYDLNGLTTRDLYNSIS